MTTIGRDAWSYWMRAGAFLSDISRREPAVAFTLATFMYFETNANSPGCPLLETHSSAFQVCMDHCRQMLQVQMVCGMQRILQCRSCQGVEAEQGWGRAPCQRRASGTRAPAQAGPGRHAGRRCAHAAPPPPAAAARGSWRTARRRSSSGSRTPAAAPFRPVTPREVRAHDDTSWLPVYCHHH